MHQKYEHPLQKNEKKTKKPSYEILKSTPISTQNQPSFTVSSKLTKTHKGLQLKTNEITDLQGINKRKPPEVEKRGTRRRSLKTEVKWEWKELKLG